jgi:hypothetical protein
VDETETAPADNGAKPTFADFVVSICFYSQHSSAEQLSEILGLRPTHSRILDPSPDDDAGARHRICFLSAYGLRAAPFALGQFDAHLLAQLRPFASAQTDLRKFGVVVSASS